MAESKTDFILNLAINRMVDQEVSHLRSIMQFSEAYLAIHIIQNLLH